jgi:hypothetical protein
MTHQYPLHLEPPHDRWTPKDLVSQLLEARKQNLLIDVVFNKVECVAGVVSNPDDIGRSDTTFRMYHQVMFAENTPREKAVKVSEYINKHYNLEVSLSSQEVPYKDPFVNKNPDLVSTYSAYELRIYNRVTS